MHLRKAATKNISARIMLLGILFIIGAWFSHASAQTVLSPTPIMPFQERSGSVIEDIQVETSTASEDAADQPDEKQFHIPLVLNESVESQLRYFTTRGRAVFQAWLDRSARYLPIMKKIFREHNLPEDLVYVAMIESGFNPHAVSPKKAVGPWQFMRPTAREYGLNTDGWVDERKDPIKSTRAAAAHFKDLYNIFGSWVMALASYNAGMGRMQGAVIKAQTDDFWELRASRFMHLETQEYVPRYMAALIIAKDPVAYGFTDPQAEPFEYDEVVIQKSTDLQRIARATGSSYQQIRELNPELLQAATPQSRYVLRIPRGSKKAYQKQIVKASAQERKFREKQNQAGPGDTLFARMASAVKPKIQDRRGPVSIVSRYAAQLSLPHMGPQ